MTSVPLLIVQTYFCVPPPRRREPDHYEVHLAPDPAPRAPLHRCQQCLVLVTDDTPLYEDALDAEGTDQRFLAHWHREGDRGTRQVLDALEPAA